MTGKVIRIGIDIDNVISDSFPFFISRFNEAFGTTISFQDITEFYYFEKFAEGKDIDVPNFIDKLLADNDFQINLPPIKDAKRIISSWMRIGHHIHYITARPPTAGKITKKWLSKHGLWHKRNSLTLFDTDSFTTDIEYKHTVISNKKIDILIEDKYDITVASKITTLLLDKPWNKGKLPETSWIDINREVLVYLK
jgi:uncharacterized HAD superfamily protein